MASYQDWVRKDPVDFPPIIQVGRMVWDGAVAALFGGFADTGFGSTFTNDTWLWDDTNWTLASPGTKPSRRMKHAMSALLPGAVMFSGQPAAIGAANYSDETWEWDGSDWSQITPSDSPDPRHFANMAYDEVNDQAVLYGGNTWDGDPFAVSNPGIPNQETWVYDGDWTEMSPSVVPAFGTTTSWFYLAMWWDPLTNSVLLITGDLNLYSWDGSDWTLVMDVSGIFDVVSNAPMSGQHSANLNLGVVVTNAVTYLWDGSTFTQSTAPDDFGWGNTSSGLQMCRDGNGDVVEFGDAQASGDGAAATRVYELVDVPSSPTLNTHFNL